MNPCDEHLGSSELIFVDWSRIPVFDLMDLEAGHAYHIVRFPMGFHWQWTPVIMANTFQICLL